MLKIILSHQSQRNISDLQETLTLANENVNATTIYPECYVLKDIKH